MRRHVCDVCNEVIANGAEYGVVMVGTRHYDPKYPAVKEWMVGEDARVEGHKTCIRDKYAALIAAVDNPTADGGAS